MDEFDIETHADPELADPGRSRRPNRRPDRRRS